jgi:hypothetical protein
LNNKYSIADNINTESIYNILNLENEKGEQIIVKGEELLKLSLTKLKPLPPPKRELLPLPPIINNLSKKKSNSSQKSK